jgi:hypothetical protein
MKLANFLQVPWRAIPRFRDVGPDLEIIDREKCRAAIICTVTLEVEGVLKETYVSIFDDLPLELAEHIVGAHDAIFK